MLIAETNTPDAGQAIEAIRDLPPVYYGIGLGVIHLLYGLLSVFAGYRTLRALLVITGAIGGALAGWLLAGQLTGSMPATIAIAAGSALVLAVLFYFLYYVAIFALGAIVAGGVTWLVLDPMVGDPMVVLGISAGVAVVGGLLALLLRRPIVIVMTSAAGALWTGVGGLLLLSGGKHRIAQALIDLPSKRSMPRLRELIEGPERIYFLIAVAVLFVLGVIVQAATTRKKPDAGKN